MNKELEQLEDELMTVNIRIICIQEDLSIKTVIYKKFLERQKKIFNRIKEIKNE